MSDPERSAKNESSADEVAQCSGRPRYRGRCVGLLFAAAGDGGFKCDAALEQRIRCVSHGDDLPRTWRGGRADEVRRGVARRVDRPREGLSCSIRHTTELAGRLGAALAKWSPTDFLMRAHFIAGNPNKLPDAVASHR
jgi:hypothetical protein